MQRGTRTGIQTTIRIHPTASWMARTFRWVRAFPRMSVPSSKTGDTLPCPVSVTPSSRQRHPLAEIDQAIIELQSAAREAPQDDGTGPIFTTASRNSDVSFKEGDGFHKPNTWAGLIRSTLYLALCQTDMKILRGLLISHAATVVMWIEQLDKDAADGVHR